MAEISRRLLVLALLGVDSSGEVAPPLRGITRLQKYLFLLTTEFGLAIEGERIEFTPYKAGPFSASLYDDLELLENLGLIESQGTAQATEAEAEELLAISFEDLFTDVQNESHVSTTDTTLGPDAYEERTYTLTKLGVKKTQELMANETYKPAINKIRKIKSKFATYSLNDLLYYVYTKYPEMTTASEIKDKVFKQYRR